MRSLRRLLVGLFRGADRGAVAVEYLAVFAFVSIGLTLAIVELGPTLLAAWDTTRTALLANKP